MCVFRACDNHRLRFVFSKTRLFCFQMDLANKLAVFEKPASLPKIAIKELQEPAKIVFARRVHTRFNTDSILLEVQMSDGEHKVTFLPARFTHILSDEDLGQFSETKEYSVKCTGHTGSTPNVLIFKH